MWAGCAEALQIATGGLASFGNRLTAMLLHQLRVAALVIVTAIATAATGPHAEANLGVSRGTRATKGTDLITGAIVFRTIFGRRIANAVRISRRKEPHTDRFLWAGTNIATDDRAVAARTIGVADAGSVARAIRADGARVADFIPTGNGQ